MNSPRKTADVDSTHQSLCYSSHLLLLWGDQEGKAGDMIYRPPERIYIARCAETLSPSCFLRDPRLLCRRDVPLVCQLQGAADGCVGSAGVDAPGSYGAMLGCLGYGSAPNISV